MYGDSHGGVFGVLKEPAVRETIESLIVAVMLALVFRAFLAEAFVIPTGSMAPSLKGDHKEIYCDESKYTYTVGSSNEGRGGFGPSATYCPITQYQTPITRDDPDHPTYSGDRILVNKYIYDFKEPERYDVIVFKFPYNGKQNYIKRLIGLPGENILIENGDIYLMHPQADGSWKKEITRKPVAKLRTTLQVVDDTWHIGRQLREVNWPLRWNHHGQAGHWSVMETQNRPIYTSPAAGDSGWLRYRHFRPLKSEWGTINQGNLPDRYKNQLPAGQLITDTYAYNDVNPRNAESYEGLHWVGDIGFECELEVKSGTGKLLLDIVEGGAHFTCEIDVSTGQATLKCDHPDVQFTNDKGLVTRPVAKTRINKPGKYHIRFVNADDQLYLWINDHIVSFDASEYLRNEVVVPKYSANDPGDAEPLGIATEGLAVEIGRLQVVRDLYYTSARGFENRAGVSNEGRFNGGELEYAYYLHQMPSEWDSARARQIFTAKKGATEPMFELKKGATPDKDQFLPMGDNSPQSLDARIWDGPHYLERELLIGRALFVYWPRALKKPLPFFPNFKDMRFIR